MPTHLSRSTIRFRPISLYEVPCRVGLSRYARRASPNPEGRAVGSTVDAACALSLCSTMLFPASFVTINFSSFCVEPSVLIFECAPRSMNHSYTDPCLDSGPRAGLFAVLLKASISRLVAQVVGIFPLFAFRADQKAISYSEWASGSALRLKQEPGLHSKRPLVWSFPPFGFGTLAWTFHRGVF
jgi:hypothetical protein